MRRETMFCGGRAAANNPASRTKYAESIRLFERALTLDPQSVEAQSRLAAELLASVLDGVTDTRAADITRAEALIAQVLAISPRYPLAHYDKGQLLRVQHQCAEAILAYELALAGNRNWPTALSHIGRCKTYLGLLEEAIVLQQQAIRLSPRDPDLFGYYFRIGEAHLLQSHIHEAIVWLERPGAPIRQYRANAPSLPPPMRSTVTPPAPPPNSLKSTN
jgi:tetratricopeptide (TPR) repeat protein